jgi:predicted protein tyrosine phosphatase
MHKRVLEFMARSPLSVAPVVVMDQVARRHNTRTDLMRLQLKMAVRQGTTMNKEDSEAERHLSVHNCTLVGKPRSGGF